MVAPFYNVQDPPLPDQCPAGGHRGLWYDRFFNGYAEKSEKSEKSEKWVLGDTAKKDWINTVEGKAGNDSALTNACTRLTSLCKHLHGETRTFATTWHFATGLGNPHPVENGFLWHPTLGTPYLPGSAVKGLVRAWVEAWMEFQSESERLKTLYRWFGAEDKDPAERKRSRENGFQPPGAGDVDTETGAFIFFDALPTKPVTLKADVMTPHMGKWYEQGDEIDNIAAHPEQVPADWHDPVPVYFLVADKPTFCFAIAPRRIKDKEEVAKVMDALAEALEWLGAGAKTAVGYGHMNPSQSSVLANVTETDFEQATLLWKAGQQLLEARPVSNKQSVASLKGAVAKAMRDTLPTNNAAVRKLQDGELVVLAKFRKTGNLLELIGVKMV